jgi:hypothetical protein
MIYHLMISKPTGHLGWISCEIPKFPAGITRRPVGKAGRDFSGEHGIQAPRKSLKLTRNLEFMHLTFQLDLLSDFPVYKNKFLLIWIINWQF